MSYQKFVMDIMEELRRIPKGKLDEIEKKAELLFGRNNKALDSLLSETMNDAIKYYENYMTGTSVKDIVEKILDDMEKRVEKRMQNRMDFEQFTDMLQKELLVQGEKRGVEIGFSEVPKNGGVLHAANLRLPDSCVGLSMHMEDGFRSYQAGMSLDSIADQMISFYEKELASQRIPEIPQGDFRIENIVPVLLPREGNEALFQTIPHIPLEDLEITFKFDVPGVGMATVDNGFMKKEGITAKELLDLAMNNPMYKKNITITPLVEVIQNLQELPEMETEDLVVSAESDNKMMVISNEANFYGAAAVLDAATIQKVKEMFGEDIYILPSSLHECIAIGKSTMDIQSLREMVRDINMGLVERGEWLSDEVYQYDPVTKKLSIVQEEQQMEMDRSYDIGWLSPQVR